MNKSQNSSLAPFNKHMLALPLLLIGIQVTGRCDASDQNQAEVVSMVTAAQSAKGNEKTQALNAIRSIKPTEPEHVDALVGALKCTDLAVQNAAQDALAQVSPGTMSLKPKYIDLLSDSNLKVQIAGMKGVQILNATEAIPEIHSILSRQPHFKFLGNGFSPNPIPFESDSFQLEQQTMQTLIDLGDESAIDDILSRDELLIGANAGALLSKKFGAKVLPKLSAIARNKNDVRSMNADRAITFIEDENAVPQLIQMLKDPNLHVSAAYALGRISVKSPAAKQAVDGQYNNMTLRDQANYMHEILATGLSQGAVPSRNVDSGTITRAKNLLDKSIQGRDFLVEYEVLQSLVATRDPRVAPILQGYLKDSKLPQRDPQLLDRTLAAWGLWKITGIRYEIPSKRPIDKILVEDEWKKLDQQESQLKLFGK